MKDTSYESYANNPPKFVREILGNEVQYDKHGKQTAGNFPKQDEILMSVLNNKRTVVRAPNGAGKSIVCGQLILWATSVFKDCTVITTAGSGRQVLSLWVEVNRMYSRCKIPLGGDILQTQLRFDNLKSRAYGFSTNKPEKFEGWHCLTPDHEVLTMRGFVPIAEVTTKDMVLSVKLLTSQATWKPVTDIFSYDVKDQWINEYNGKSVSFAMTDEHRIPSKSKPGRRGWKLKKFSETGRSFMVRRLCQWKTGPSYDKAGYRMPNVFRDMGFTPEQYAEFVGWWAAEGHTHWTKNKKGGKVYYSVTLTQIKPEGRDKIRKLLEGIQHVERHDEFVISNRRLGAWLRYNCGKHSYEKRLPRSLVDARPVMLEAIMRGLIGGDGSKHTESDGATFYTTSPVLRDQVQEISIKLGRPGTIGINREPGETKILDGHECTTKHTCYAVSMPERGTDLRASKHDVERRLYTGKVHCLSTPQETFLVRRNGRVFFSGNSKRILVIIDEAKAVQQNIMDASERLLTSGDWVRQMVVSSPGSPMGPFYDCFGKHHKLYTQFHIKMGESPYVDPGHMELLKQKYGETSPFYLSSVMGEFSSVDDPLIVIPLTFVQRAVEDPPIWEAGRGACAGIDLAAGGGDECAYSLIVGNRQMRLRRWTNPNTMESAGQIIRWFKEDREQFGLEADAVNIDDGSFGHAVIDRLHELGYYFNRFNFGGSPIDGTAYHDAGAEVWYEARLLLERGEIGLMQGEDEAERSTVADLQNQLTARKRIARSDGRIQLEPKKVMKKRTHCSPDLADATVLSLAGRRGVALTMAGKGTEELKTSDEEKDPEEELKDYMRRMQENAERLREEREKNG